MPIPDTRFTILSTGLGIDPNAGAKPHVKMGWSYLGTPNVRQSFSTRAALFAALGGGPLAEAAAYAIATSGGPVDVVPLTQTAAGSVGSVTQTNPAAGISPALTFPAISAVTSSGTTPPVVTLTGTPLSASQIVVTITTAGTLGTAQYSISYDNGKTFTLAAATAASIALAGLGSGLTIAFAAGTYATNNVYTSAIGVPFDGYEIYAIVVGGGALGAASFQYALDGLNPAGPTLSAVVTIPASGVYVVPGTGVAFTFAAGTYVAGSTYSAQAVAPAFSNASIASGFTALQATANPYAFVHVVGQAASVAAGAAQAALLDGYLAAGVALFEYAFAAHEVPLDTDANTLTAYAAYTSERTSPCAGFARLTSYGLSSTAGMALARNTAWIATATEAGVPGPGVDPAQFSLGPRLGVQSISRDEASTPGLDAAGFTTLRTYKGQGGYYLTNGRFPAPSGSSFVYWQYRRVIDEACGITRTAALPLLSAAFRTNPANGTIYEVDAQTIEARLTQALNNGLVALTPRAASGVRVAVDRTVNFAATNQLNVTIFIQPLGYAKQIAVTIGLSSTLPS